MEKFQKRLSNRAANASAVWVRNDSNGMTAIDAKASVRSITIPTLCAIINRARRRQPVVFLSPAKAGRIIWGVEPIVSFPTATENILGTKKLSVGPTIVALRSQGHWLYGMLVNNLFSVAGPSARPDVNQMLAQPFVSYNLRHGWYLTSLAALTWSPDCRARPGFLQ